jgi:hypothetical protein
MISISKTIKRIKDLQKLLGAPSGFHKLRDLKQLEGHLESVGRILDEIPQAKEQLTRDMAMAGTWREYLKRKKMPKPKVEKPVLNTDDLDDMF